MPKRLFPSRNKRVTKCIYVSQEIIKNNSSCVNEFDKNQKKKNYSFRRRDIWFCLFYTFYASKRVLYL